MKFKSVLMAALFMGAALALAAGTHAGQPAAPEPAKAPKAAASAESAYKEVDLDALVKKVRGPQRVIIKPTPVSFTATLEGLPRAQKSDYLQKALAMMHMSSPPQVNHGVLLGHGKDGRLPAYIEDATAQRLAREGKPGEKRKFYAFHVYNYSKGPALLVVSFGERM